MKLRSTQDRGRNTYNPEILNSTQMKGNSLLSNQETPPQINFVVTLRLTVSQSVRLGVEPTVGLGPDINSVWKLLSCLCGAPSLKRGRVCLLSVTVSSNYPLSSLFFCLFFPHFTCHAFYVYTTYSRPQPAKAQYSRSRSAICRFRNSL
jgi:hypothetical protein